MKNYGPNGEVNERLDEIDSKFSNTLDVNNVTANSISSKDLDIKRESDNANIISYNENAPNLVLIGDKDVNDGDINIVIKGNVFVSGTTTTLNAQELNVENNEIVLNNIENGIPAPLYDASLKVYRYETNPLTKYFATLKWNETTDKWEFEEPVKVNGSLEISNVFTSTLSNGTSPFSILSSTLVSNLNADLLDGEQGSYYTNVENINNGILAVTHGGTGLSSIASGQIPYGIGNNIYDKTDLTDFARTILDDTTQNAARTTLGVGTGDSPLFNSVSTSIDLIVGTSGIPGVGTTEIKNNRLLVGKGRTTPGSSEIHFYASTGEYALAGIVVNNEDKLDMLSQSNMTLQSMAGNITIQSSAGNIKLISTTIPTINDIDIVTISDSQTLTNKTLASPIVATPTLTLKNSTTPSQIVSGEIEWDSDSYRITVGDGSGTRIFSDDIYNNSTFQLKNTDLYSNFIINPIDENMVDQYGTTSPSSVSNDTYVIDMWKVFENQSTNPTFTKGGDYIEIKANASHSSPGAIGFFQLMENVNYNKLKGKTITISCNIVTDNTSSKIVVYDGHTFSNSTQVINADGSTVNKVSVTKLVNNNATELTVYIGIQSDTGMPVTLASEDFCRISKCKLEISSFATEYKPRLYDNELRLCQRYYYKYSSSVSSATVATGICLDNIAYLTTALPVPMRATPAISVSGDYFIRLYNMATAAVATDFNTIASITLIPNSTILHFTYTTAGYNYSIAQMTTWNTTAHTIIFNANL